MHSVNNVLVPVRGLIWNPVPEGLTDEMLSRAQDIYVSLGFKVQNTQIVRLGDVVVVFAQGPLDFYVQLRRCKFFCVLLQLLRVRYDDRLADYSKKLGAGHQLSNSVMPSCRRSYENHKGVELRFNRKHLDSVTFLSKLFKFVSTRLVLFQAYGCV